MDNLEIFDKDGKVLHIADVIGHVALHIRHDLSRKAMQLMKDNDSMRVEDFRELPEFRKLCCAMDVINQHYL